MQYPLPAKPVFAASSSTSTSNGSLRGNPWLQVQLQSDGGAGSQLPGLNSLRELRGDLQRVQDAAQSRQLTVREAIAAISASASMRPARAGRAAAAASSRHGGDVATTTTATATNGRDEASGSRGATPTSTQANRGTKRARLDSESSLSPTSTTSTSSIIENHTHPSLPGNAQGSHSRASAAAGTSSSRAASPAGSALGLSSSRLSKHPSTNSSNKGKAPESQSQSTLPPAAIPPPALAKDGAIPGVNAPVPSLPGFRRKKKEASPSPASQGGPSSARASPAPQNNSSSHDYAGPSTSSTLPPAPPTLPPRPAGLPLKPPPPSRANSYQQQAGHSSRRERERSSGWPVDSDEPLPSKRGGERTESWQSDTSTNERKQRERERSRDTTEVPPPPLLANRMSEDAEAAGTRSRSVSLSAGSPPGQDSSTTRTRSISPLPPKPPPQEQQLKQAKSTATLPDKPDIQAVPTVAVSSPPIDSATDQISTKPDKQTDESKSDAVASGTKPSTTGAIGTSDRQSAGPPIARKGLPPSASGVIKASPAIQAVQASNPGSTAATGAGGVGPPSRPGTPLGRKALPPSVVVSSSLAKSSSSLGKDKSLALGLASSLSGQGSAIANDTDAKGKGKASSPAPGGVAPLSSREAERQRKRDKKKNKKRKLADLAAAATASGENGGTTMTRSDSLGPPPNKQRRIDGSPGDAAGAAAAGAGAGQGLRVKLNGFSLNRSTTPGDGNTFAQPALPKKTIAAPGVADDFSLPSRSLIPAAPAIVVPTPTPSRQIDIDDDFDYAKPASQVPYTTFANWVHDYLRSYGEDDLAFLAAKSSADPTSEEVGNLYTVPAIGPHYLDAWAAMDAELVGDQATLPGPSTALVPPLTKRLRAENLSIEKLGMENYSLGPLGERVMAAFRGTSDFQSLMQDLLADQQHRQQRQEQQQPAAEAVPGEQPNSSTLPAAESMPQQLQISPPMSTPALFGDLAQAGPTIKELDVQSFESRLTRELGFLGVIPPGTLITRVTNTSSASTSNAAAAGAPKKSSSGTVEVFESPIDWASREDDEISSSLRACQRLLKDQVKINERRKAALAERVQARIAYQEYEALRDGLESVIEGAWAKRQRAAQRKAYKDKKDKDRKEKDRDKLEAASLAQSIAALNQPQQLSSTLIAALTKRRNLVDGFAHLFPEGAGLLPTASVYEGLDLGANVVARPPQAAPSVE